jgi:hypothetical protein
MFEKFKGRNYINKITYLVLVKKKKTWQVKPIKKKLTLISNSVSHLLSTVLLRIAPLSSLYRTHGLLTVTHVLVTHYTGYSPLLPSYQEYTWYEK